MKKFLYVARPAFQGEITLILQPARGGLLLRPGLAEQQALGHQPSPCTRYTTPKGRLSAGNSATEGAWIIPMKEQKASAAAKEAAWKYFLSTT